MRLGKVPMKAEGGAKRNASLEQGAQVSTATKRGGNHHQARHTKRSGDTYQPLWLGQPRAREGEGVDCCTDA